MKKRCVVRSCAVPLFLGFLPACAAACSVCFSDPTSQEGTARNWAVLSLLLFIVPVLAVIAWTGMTWIRREQEVEATRAPARRS